MAAGLRQVAPPGRVSAGLYVAPAAGFSCAEGRGTITVAVEAGKVLVAGAKLMEVLEKASASGGHPYIALVGAEDEVIFRVRRAVFAYDQAYQPFPLPRVSATFWNHAGTHSQQHPDVIPDTGADVSLLPDPDCTAMCPGLPKQ